MPGIVHTQTIVGSTHISQEGPFAARYAPNADRGACPLSVLWKQESMRTTIGTDRCELDLRLTEPVVTTIQTTDGTKLMTGSQFI